MHDIKRRQRKYLLCEFKKQNMSENATRNAHHDQNHQQHRHPSDKRISIEKAVTKYTHN